MFMDKLIILDPFELINRKDQLRPEEKSYLHNQLEELKACKGKSCTVGTSPTQPASRIKSNQLPINSFTSQFHKFKKKKINDEYSGGK